MKNPLSLKIMYGLCIILVLSGCGMFSSKRKSAILEPVRYEKQLSVAQTLRFEDVPVPDGFDIMRDRSFVFQDTSTRVGFLKYIGREDPNKIIAFYKTQMPLYNWNLLTVVEYGNISINFSKGNENCIITILPSSGKSIIDIMLSPKGSTTTPGFVSEKIKVKN